MTLCITEKAALTDGTVSRGSGVPRRLINDRGESLLGTLTKPRKKPRERRGQALVVSRHCCGDLAKLATLRTATGLGPFGAIRRIAVVVRADFSGFALAQRPHGSHRRSKREEQKECPEHAKLPTFHGQDVIAGRTDVKTC